MRFPSKRKLKFIRIEYKVCSSQIRGKNDDIILSDYMFLDHNFIELKRKFREGGCRTESELSFKKKFATDDFLAKYRKIYDSILDLGEIAINTSSGPTTTITLFYFIGGISHMKIIRDIPNTLLYQGFNELVDLLLDILPSDWVVPKFCEM